MTSEPQTEYLLRTAGEDDAQMLARQRSEIYETFIKVEDREVFQNSSIAAFKDLLDEKQLFSWLVESNGDVVAAAALITRRLLPNSTNATGCTEAFVIHVYTEPPYRRRGLAKRLMSVIVDWCREQNVERITLQATEQGRALYTSLGFKPTTEMRLDVKAKV